MGEKQSQNPGIEQSKKSAALKAVSYIEQKMIVGLGTGSTVYFALEELGKRVAQGLQIKGVPTSGKTELLAKKFNIPVYYDFERIDVTIDGADEVDFNGNLIKGGGGALTREKIVASASEKVIIVVDHTKLVEQLGAFPLPVEILPFGMKSTQKQLQSLGCEVQLRKKNGQIFTTDNQNYICDCKFKHIKDAESLARQINAIPGVVENGLFVGMADLIVTGYPDGTVKEQPFSH